MMDLYEAATRFVRWLNVTVTAEGRGDHLQQLGVEPSGRFWLGRLAPEEAVVELGLGERGERLDPCATGLVVQPAAGPPWRVQARVTGCAWLRRAVGNWEKTPTFDVTLDLAIEDRAEPQAFGKEALQSALSEVTSNDALSAEVRAEVRHTPGGSCEVAIVLVNTSPAESDELRDTNLYECSLRISGLATAPFLLEALPDSFRYDRAVRAFGLNCGVAFEDGALVTEDAPAVDRLRPTYWTVDAVEPDLTFDHLAEEPIQPLAEMLEQLKAWGLRSWSQDTLKARRVSESWSEAMLSEASAEAERFGTEVARFEAGLDLLRNKEDLRSAFQNMNASMSIASGGRYDRWRAFQLGFLVSALPAITDPDTEADVADIIWFATGGGKTETYLGLIITAAFFDRLSGKESGVTAWSRFPLRMLSLQQTQRFADAMAGAELVRRREQMPGDTFSVGFLVGREATPNRIKPQPEEWEPDPDDESMPAHYQVLLTCPFCRSKSIEMGFNRRYWTLEHRCSNSDCVWPEERLPFYIVDDEIYRFLPTVVVGTVDKAASLSMQAAMRGLVGPPHGVCSEEGHGFVYAPRSDRRTGCLVPGCRGTRVSLTGSESNWGLAFRLQDELHIMRDSLGAVDAHYEALLDHLQDTLTGTKPKILGSSATLTGSERQVDVLYRRKARVFPLQGPTIAESFWTVDTEDLARLYVAVAPRGVTLEYTVDRMLTELQRAVRRLISDPQGVCDEIGIPASHADDLLSIYGVDVVYGNTIRDLEASLRSVETQVQVEGELHSAALTGRTEFDEVRTTLDRLSTPEEDFGERIHVVGASSMMSHGVDIDRLNVMIMLGVPLTTAEFIQATSRVGRARPGLVYVLHKIARERDAGVFRAFSKFVTQGDRFVEAVPVTRRSRRVLERTIAGIELARILMVHEPAAAKALTRVRSLREYFQSRGITDSDELSAVVAALELDDPLDELLRADLAEWFDIFFNNLMDPGGTFVWPRELSPTGEPMLSLRDVEEQVPVYGLMTR